MGGGVKTVSLHPKYLLLFKVLIFHLLSSILRKEKSGGYKEK